MWVPDLLSTKHDVRYQGQIKKKEIALLSRKWESELSGISKWPKPTNMCAVNGKAYFTHFLPHRMCWKLRSPPSFCVGSSFLLELLFGIELTQSTMTILTLAEAHSDILCELQIGAGQLQKIRIKQQQQHFSPYFNTIHSLQKKHSVQPDSFGRCL